MAEHDQRFKTLLREFLPEFREWPISVLMPHTTIILERSRIRRWERW